jgi:hypothetical protein
VYDRQNSVSQDSPPSALAAAARAFYETICDHTSNALRVALDAGDTLTWAKAKDLGQPWVSWLAQHCPRIKPRTDGLYRQLAAHRDVIERELRDDPGMGIRDARKLIMKARPKSPKPSRLQSAWKAADVAERQECLAADSVDDLLLCLPAGWAGQLADRGAKVTTRKAGDRELTRLVRKLLIEILAGKTPNTVKLAQYIAAAGLEVRHIEVRVGTDDAPSKRRQPLIGTNSNVIPFSPASPPAN